MLFSIASLCGLLTYFTFLPISRACRAPPGTNFKQIPRFWCKMDAHVSITATCNIEVEETITVPWSTGMIDRFVPTEENQRIEDLSAYRIRNRRKISTYSVLRPKGPPGNAVVSVRAVSTRVPLTILIKYKQTGGIQMFSQCSGMGDFKNVNSSLENTLMMSKWAVGGRSAAKVNRVGVRFVLPRQQSLQYLDTLTTAHVTFKQEIGNQADDTNEPVRVIYEVAATEVAPSALFFYVRFMMRFGAQTCRFARNCEAEDRIIKEGRLMRSHHKIMLGLTLGLGFLVIAVSIVTWVCCCKWSREREGDLYPDGNAPVSLTHCTYEDGNEQQRRQRDEWTEASPKSSEMKAEFYALDLSPRHRERRESDGF